MADPTIQPITGPVAPASVPSRGPGRPTSPRVLTRSRKAQKPVAPQNWTTSIYGTSPDYFAIRNWPTARGQAMTESDAESDAKVCFLGQTVVDKLFGENADPVGQLVRIKNIPFQVNGVLEKKGQSPVGQDYDDAVFIPLKTFQTKTATTSSPRRTTTSRSAT